MRLGSLVRRVMSPDRPPGSGSPVKRRLVVGGVAAAIVAGAVTSVIAPPSTRSVGGSACYTNCATTTNLSLSKTSVAVGSENTETFSVSVTATGATTKPSGAFAVNNGTTKLCGGSLNSSGDGTCALSASQLPAGSYPSISATYAGVTGKFTGSKSANKALTVTGGAAAATTTALKLAKTSVAVGSENTEVFTVTVTAKTGTAKPSGAYAVNNGTTKLCGTTLNTSGVGTCALSASQLPAGSYPSINATYAGVTGKFASSKSANAALTVTKATNVATSTTLTAPKSAVIGGETAERFSATVKAATGTAKPAGTVAIVSGTTTLCHATVVAGVASCTLTATQLKIGSYSAKAVFTPGAGFLGSTSVAATFSIVKGTPTASFTMPATSVSHTSEAGFKFTVSVKAPAGDTLFATSAAVNVMAGTKVACHFALTAASKGAGSCTLTAGELAKSSTPYVIKVVYGGDANFNAATSATKTLTVT
jgi:hypothetical protein